MLKRIVHETTLTLLLAGTLVLAVDVRCIRAYSGFETAVFKTWTVDDDGPADFHTIQEAINAASSGDTVLVKSGTYHEHLDVNKVLLVVAESRNNSIIDAGFTGTAVNITANGAWIDDLAIRNAAQSALCICGDDNRISGVDIFFDNSSGFPEHQIGVDIHSSRNLIEECTILDSQYGGIAITTDLGDAKDACNNTIISNRISAGGYGVVLQDVQIPTPPSVYDNRIIGNTIFSNSENSVGIYLLMTYGNTVAYNTIMNNGGGILLEYSYGSYGAGENAIHHNNLINNTHSVVGTYQSYGYMWDDGSEGNYWSDYGGIDVDDDGIGDSAYVIDENNRDNRPLMKPAIKGDANLDGIVNIKDASLLALSWLSRKEESRYNSHVDFNLDGIINIKDATMIGVNWQKHI